MPARGTRRLHSWARMLIHAHKFIQQIVTSFFCLQTDLFSLVVSFTSSYWVNISWSRFLRFLSVQFRCTVLKIHCFGEVNWLGSVGSLDDRMRFQMPRFPSTYSFVMEVLPLVLKRCWMRNIPARKRSWGHSLMQIRGADLGDNFYYKSLVLISSGNLRDREIR